MSAIAYTPGPDNAPFGNLNTNPEASNLAVESQFTPTESNLIRKAIKRAIFDAAPEQYNALKLVFAQAPEEVNLDEFEYLETTFGRSPLVAATGDAAQAAAPNVSQTQTFDLTAASITRVTNDLVIIYPNNSQGVITDVTGVTITVESLTGAGLPLVAIGDVFAIRSTISADGQDFFSNYERTETVTRFNYIQFFTRAMRWGRVEMQKYINAGTTDFLSVDKQHRIRQIRVDMFNSFFNGERGEFAIANAYAAKSMGGVYPTMVNAGSLSANPTLAGFQTAFETLAFQTNFKREGGVRFVYGTDEILYEFSKIYKQPGLRYAPNDEIANLNLDMIKIGTMKFVLVPCELFKETSCFPAEWNRRILVLDQETIRPIKMKGLPQFEMGMTLDRGTSGTREMFKDWYVWAQLSIRFHNPLASFWMDIQ